MQKYAPVLVRFSMSLVFLYFAVSQLLSPKDWLAFLPVWTTALPISQVVFIIMNSLFELVFGTLLFFGIYTRGVSLLLALHLFGIAFSIGFDALGVRDFGLAFATLSVFLYGADHLSFDSN